MVEEKRHTSGFRLERGHSRKERVGRGIHYIPRAEQTYYDTTLYNINDLIFFFFFCCFVDQFKHS